jgi:hypothetical protein
MGISFRASLQTTGGTSSFPIPCARSRVGLRRDGSCGAAVEDGQLKSAEPASVGEDVDLGDPAAADR